MKKIPKTCQTFILILLLLVSLIGNNQAQSPTFAPQIFPPTPQTQLFEKYINHAITEYNGLAQITIPLYEMEIKGLKIPITLSYHGGGIKYKGYDGDIGAGWSINAGGYRVFRTIYGKPDELFPLYNQNTLNSYENPQKDGYLAGIGLYDGGLIMAQLSGNSYKDGEYDQFTYMLPKTSGQFLISDRAAKTLARVNPNQDIIILDESSSTLKLDSIKIIDNAGFEYYAGGMQPGNILLAEKSRSNNEYKTSWPVAKIKSPFNETINFKYAQYDIDMSRENHHVYQINDATIIQGYAPPGPPSSINNYTISEPTEVSRIIEKMYFVNEIKSEKETITFNRAVGSQVISSIVITNNIDNSQLTITFNYTTSDIHQLLSGLTVNGKTYSFDYYGPPASPQLSYSDQWGYYKYPNTEGDFFGLTLHEEFKNDYYLNQYYTNGPFLIEKQIKENLSFFYPKWLDRTTNENPSYFSLKTIKVSIDLHDPSQKRSFVYVTFVLNSILYG